MKVIEEIKDKTGKVIRRRVHEDMKEVCPETGEIVAGVSMTDQSFQKDCDVNEIIRRFEKTGQISHLAKNPGVYEDVSHLTDLLDMHNKVAEAREMFDALPATLRAKLQNDPVNMIDWLQDPKNDEEAIFYGLKQARQEYSPGSKQAEGALDKPQTKKSSGQNKNDLNDKKLTDDE